MSRRLTLGLLAAMLAISIPLAYANKQPKPMLDCDELGKDFIKVKFSAGGGVPAKGGHEIQFMTSADYKARGNQFYGSFCRPRWTAAVLPGSPLDHKIGTALKTDSDVYHLTDTCKEALKCSTTYVFRAFSLVYTKNEQTGWKWFNSYPSDVIKCTTKKCSSDGCTYTQGYWKTHLLSWPLSSLQLGTSGHWYNKAQLVAIMIIPDGGNGLLKLAHQLIAAELNIANGASDVPVQQQVADAKALLQHFNPLIGTPLPSISSSSSYWTKAVQLAKDLDDYNNGKSGVSHCK